MKRILCKNCLGEYELRDENYRIIATGTMKEMVKLHVLFYNNERKWEEEYKIDVNYFYSENFNI